MTKSRNRILTNRINEYLEKKRTRIRFSNIKESQLEKLSESWPSERLMMKQNIPNDTLKLELLSQVEDQTVSISKPGFLITMEEKLQKRLEEHGLLNTPPSIERLFIFREIFDFIICSFKSYSPLLAVIKREYDGVIQHYRDEAKKIEPAQELIWLVSQHHDENIIEIQRKEFSEISRLKAEVEKFKAEITSLHNSQVNETFERNRMKEVLAETEEKRLREMDYNRTLLTKLNHTRVDFEAFENAAKMALALRDSDEDPEKLKLALNKAREAHTKVLTKLTKMEADYGDVIPRKEYEIAKQHANELEQELAILKENYGEMAELVATQQEKMKDTTEEYNMLDAKYTTLKVQCTPRPDFKQHALLIGGRKRWKDISMGLSTQEKLILFIQELTSGSLRPERNSYRDAQTFIPTFLNDTKDVNPRFISQRELLLVIEDIWLKRKFQLDQFMAKKSVHLDVIVNLPTFDAFLAEYFKVAFGIQFIRKEWALAIYNAADFYADCEEIVRFRKVAENEMDESYYWYLQSLTNRIFHHLKEISRATIIASTSVIHSDKGNDKEVTQTDNGDKFNSSFQSHKLTPMHLQTSLAKLLRCEPEDPAVAKLVQVAFSQLNPLINDNSENEDDRTPFISVEDSVSLDDLFKQESGEPMPAFVRMVVEQLELGKRTVLDHIVMELQRHKFDSDNPENIQLSDLVNAIKSAHPELEKVLEASPRSFISSTARDMSDQGRHLSIDSNQHLETAPCDLDETGATQEEQALAWAWCQETVSPRNYLLATLNWMFQQPTNSIIRSSSTSEVLPQRIVEKRLHGANIKPINIITAYIN